MDILGYQFTYGAELADGTAIFAARYPQTDADTGNHTVVLILTPDGTWSEGPAFSRNTVAMTVNPSGDSVLMMDEDGTLLDYGSGTENTSAIKGPGDPNDMAMRSLALIGGEVFAGGMDHHVYHRTGRGVWTDISVDHMREDDIVRGFEALCGTGMSELYAVGFDGAIYCRLNDRWERIESPTNLTLKAATFADDRFIVVGLMGTIVEGRGNDWRIIEQDETEEDFFGAATFKGTTFVSNEVELYRLAERELELEIVADEEDVASIGPLFSGYTGLWSVGTHDILKFDGEDWDIVAQSW